MSPRLASNRAVKKLLATVGFWTFEAHLTAIPYTIIQSYNKLWIGFIRLDVVYMAQKWVLGDKDVNSRVSMKEGSYC